MIFTFNISLHRTAYSLDLVQPYLLLQRWFTERSDGGGEIEPTFVVTSRLDQDKLRQLFGEPGTVVKFKKDQFVWIYDEPLPLIPAP